MLGAAERTRALFLIEEALDVPRVSTARQILEGSKPITNSSGYFLWLLFPYLLTVGAVAKAIEISQHLGGRRSLRREVAALCDFVSGDGPRRWLEDGRRELVLVRFSVMAPLGWNPARTFEGIALLGRQGDALQLVAHAAGSRAGRAIDEGLIAVRRALAARAPATQLWHWRLHDASSLVVDDM